MDRAQRETEGAHGLTPPLVAERLRVGFVFVEAEAFEAAALADALEAASLDEAAAPLIGSGKRGAKA